MKTQDYNADSICRCLGLSQFIDETWANTETTVIRIIFKPSFHPEVVVTITKSHTGIFLQTVAAGIQIWSLDWLQPITSFFERANLSESVFQQIVQSFDLAFDESRRRRKTFCVDGMGMDVCCLKESQLEEFETHISASKVVDKFAAEFTKVAWEACTRPEVKNALSCAGRYAGLKLPKVEVCDLPAKPQLGIVLLGAPEEKEALSKAIKKSTGGDSNAK